MPQGSTLEMNATLKNESPVGGTYTEKNPRFVPEGRWRMPRPSGTGFFTEYLHTIIRFTSLWVAAKRSTSTFQHHCKYIRLRESAFSYERSVAGSDPLCPPSVFASARSDPLHGHHFYKNKSKFPKYSELLPKIVPYGTNLLCFTWYILKNQYFVFYWIWLYSTVYFCSLMTFIICPLSTFTPRYPLF